MGKRFVCILDTASPYWLSTHQAPASASSQPFVYTIVSTIFLCAIRSSTPPPIGPPFSFCSSPTSFPHQNNEHDSRLATITLRSSAHIPALRSYPFAMLILRPEHQVSLLAVSSNTVYSPDSFPGVLLLKPVSSTPCSPHARGRSFCASSHALTPSTVLRSSCFRLCISLDSVGSNPLPLSDLYHSTSDRR